MKKIIQKIKRVLQNPSLIKERMREKKYKWHNLNSESNHTFKKKKYDTYKEYIEHQKSKLDKVSQSWLPEYDKKYRKVLHDRLKEGSAVKGGENVLCLAARLGTEVKAFLDLGCFAIGIDLNPGEGNKHVVSGDFHDIQFPDNVVDIVFTNSIDHSFDLIKMIGEISRVLKDGGLLILELVKGEKEGGEAGYYESCWWDSIDDILGIFKEHKFDVVEKKDFEYPWEGKQIVLKLNNSQ